MTHYDILPAEQRAMLPELAAAKTFGFVLYGGTAVALQLGHRESIDFDFFSDRPLDETALAAAMPTLASATTLQRDAQSWTLLARPSANARPVKLSFFGGLKFGRVGTPVPASGGEVLMASLDDLLGHKLKVLLQRVEAKDYADVAAMLRAGQSLAQGLGAAEALFPGYPVAEGLRTLGWFEGGDLTRLSYDDRVTLTQSVRTTDAAVSGVVVARALST